jgi:hypothetical protein
LRDVPLESPARKWWGGRWTPTRPWKLVASYTPLGHGPNVPWTAVR